MLETSHVNFKQNKHVKLTLTHEDTQAQSMLYLLDVMNVLGRLTSVVHTLTKDTNINHFNLKLTQEIFTNMQLTLVRFRLLHSPPL